LEPASSEVQFALVIARMIDSVRNSPEHMRQAVYDLARYKLQEQFTYADAKDIKRTQQALESAIRGVEEFSRQHPSIPPAPTPPPQIGNPDVATPALRKLPLPEFFSQARRPRLEMGLESDIDDLKPTHLPWPHLKRAAALIDILVAILVIVQQRERLTSLAQSLSRLDSQADMKKQSAPVQVANDPAPPPRPAKRAPLRPTDYGVYAISDDSLSELQLLPGRPPDIRVAVSAALRVSSRTSLPNGHPKIHRLPPGCCLVHLGPR
jgi:hypothetical protein